MNAVVLGEENSMISRQIEAKKAEIVVKNAEVEAIRENLQKPEDASISNFWTKKENAVKDFEAAKERMSDFYTKSASKIKSIDNPRLATLSYNERNFQEDILNATILADDELKHPFKHLASGNYQRGVTFEEIVALYYFDEKIRTIFLEHILHVERQIKSLLSYHFCEKYGELQVEYLNPANYNLHKKNQNDINKMINCLTKSISLPSKYGYIVHHVNKYGNVPLWVAMNAITFGNLSKMYQYCTSDIRTKVSHNYDGVSEFELHQFIRVLASL